MLKIFVPAPADLVTGGVELLHQLVDEINNHGGDAYIVYSRVGAVIQSDYRKYNIKLADKVEDNPHNVVILNETADLMRVFDIKYARIVLWWLSVDNFFIYYRKKISLFDLLRFDKKIFREEFFRRLKRFFLRKTFSLKVLRKHPRIVLNAYQSEYAKEFLIRNKFTTLFSLSDYINVEYLGNGDLYKKEDWIAYNPKKGYEFTKRLIANAPNLNWRPIMGLDRDGVIDILKRCKLYIDFGNHPGKDRLPREAAACNCIIITGIRGAGYYYNDIPIPECYKINQYKVDINSVISKLKELIYSYDNCINDFQNYRDKIKNEKRSFKEEAQMLLNILK